MVLPSAVMGQLSRDRCSCFTLGAEAAWAGAEGQAVLSPARPSEPHLPFCFRGRLQGPQRDQQLLGRHQGLHRGRCGEGEVDDLGAGEGAGWSDAEQPPATSLTGHRVGHPGSGHEPSEGPCTQGTGGPPACTPPSVHV